MDKFLTEDQRLPERFPKSDYIELGTDGWLSPQGGYYKVGTTEHDESAEYIIKNSDEVKLLEERVISNVGQRMRYDEKPYREKLKKLGFILIRGETLRSEEAANYTPQQLRAMSKVGIKIVSAFDGSIEYHPDKILQRMSEVSTNLQDDPIMMKYIQADLNSHRDLPWFQEIRTRTLEDIREFSRNPFKTVIHIDESVDPETEDIVSSRILEVLSKGFTDELKIRIGRSEYTFRMVGLNGAKLIIQREKYTHDLLGGFRHINNFINMFVTDDLALKEKLLKLIEGDSNLYKTTPKITLGNQKGYFAGIVTDLITYS